MKQSSKSSPTEFSRLGELLLTKRGTTGIRATAEEIGISAATLSRIERGYTADIDTIKKVCAWLGVELGTILGGDEIQTQPKPTASVAMVHFRKEQSIAPKTAHALAQLILAAQNQMSAQ